VEVRCGHVSLQNILLYVHFIKLGIMTVINLYIYKLLVNRRGNLTECNFRSDIHAYNTRNSGQIDTPFMRLSKTQNNFVAMGTKLFNKLPQRLRVLPMKVFKNKL